MSATENRCSGCHLELPGGASICPACGSVAERPVERPRPIEARPTNVDTVAPRVVAVPPPAAGPADAEEVPEFDDFDIVRTLGEGEGTTVFEALDSGGNRVALKVLPAGAQVPDNVWTDGLDHPNIVRVRETNREAHPPFLVLDLVRGRTLDELVWEVGNHPERFGPAYQRRMVTQFARLADALAEAHDRGMVHGAIAPWNLMLREDPEFEILLTDFGMTVDLGELRRDLARDETPDELYYLAPELVLGNADFSEAADVYALGMCLFEALIGELPFTTETKSLFLRALEGREPARARQLEPRIPADVERILARCLEKNPSVRYASVEHLRDDLLDALAAFEPIPKRVAPAVRVRTPRGSGAWAVPALIVLLLVWATVAGVRFAAASREAAGDDRRAPEPAPRGTTEMPRPPSSETGEPTAALEPEAALPPAPISAESATSLPPDDRPAPAPVRTAGAATATRPARTLPAGPVSATAEAWETETGGPESLGAAPSDPFGLGDSGVELTGIHGIVCDPRTGDPVRGATVVVLDEQGMELVSPPSGPGGRYSMPVDAGSRYELSYVETADGERHPTRRSGVGIRIWPGRYVELNVCGAPGAAAGPTTGDAAPAPAGAPAAVDVPDGAADSVSTGFYGVIHAPESGEPADGYRIVVEDRDGVEFTGPPSGPDGAYGIELPPGTRYRPVAVIDPDGRRMEVEGIGSGVRLVPGRAVRFNIRRYR